MRAGIVVSVYEIVVVSTQVLAAVSTELCCRFAAPFLMLLQFIGTAKSADIANFHFLACFQCRIQSHFHAGNSFHNGGTRSLRPCANMRLGLCMRFGFRTGLRF